MEHGFKLVEVIIDHSFQFCKLIRAFSDLWQNSPMVFIVRNTGIYDVGVVANVGAKNWPFNILMHLLLSDAGFVKV